MTAASIHAPDAMRSITLKVSGLHELKVRVWIAAQVFKFGALIVGCNITMTDEPTRL